MSTISRNAMRERIFATLAIVVFVVEGPLAYSSEPAAQQPGAEAADASSPAARGNTAAADLVRAMYEKEAWIDSATSVYVRLERKTEYSEAARRSGKDTAAKRPFTTEEVFAWDAKRVLHREYLRGGARPDGMLRLQLWDGTLATLHYETSTSKQTGLQPSYEGTINGLNQLTPWGDSYGHSFWWQPADLARQQADEFLSPADFEYLGKEEVAGRACHVVQSRAAHKRFYIGVADGLRYRLEWFNPDYKFALYRQVGGAGIKQARDWWRWLEGLSPDERRQAERKLAVLQFDPRLASVDNTWSDYREVAPGCWLPFHLVSILYSSESARPVVEWTAEHKLVEVKVNQPLADDVFRFEIPPGARVSDSRYDPPITYSFRKDQTEEDRLQLVTVERLRQETLRAEEEKRLKVIKSRVGKTPLPLPQQGWLSGEPLAWEGLRGKVVVLHFWDVNCGPCMGEMPWLEKLGNQSRDRLVVVGVHRTTTDLEAVRAKLEKLGAKYPVLIDTNSPGGSGLGQLHDWFGNTWWPNTVVIDREGRVAAHGFLHEVLD